MRAPNKYDEELKRAKRASSDAARTAWAPRATARAAESAAWSSARDAAWTAESAARTEEIEHQIDRVLEELE